MSKVPEGGLIRHDTNACGHVQALTAGEIKDYEKAPDKFGLDERTAPNTAAFPDDETHRVLHCHGCNQLRAVSEFVFDATGENLDPDIEEVEEEDEKTGKKAKVKRKKKR
jgi:hypothetical protein